MGRQAAHGTLNVPAVEHVLPLYEATPEPGGQAGTSPDKNKPLGPTPKQKASLACALLLLNCATQAIMATLASASNPAAIIMTAEAIKAGVSLVMITRDGPIARTGRSSFNLPTTLGLFMVAAMYAAVNNYNLLALRHVDIGTYELLFSLRILTTASLMRAVFKKQFSVRQRVAVLLLFLGALFSQTDLHDLGTLRPSKTGVMYIGITILGSSFAGVLNEAFLKKEELGSIHSQNFQLYVYGILINLAGVELATPNSPSVSTVFRGLSAAAWVVACSLAAQGLVTSAVIKYADNLVKASASVGSIAVSSIIAWQAFGAPLTLEVVVGGAMTSASICTFGAHQTPPLYAWEATPANVSQCWASVPADVKPRLLFYNAPVTTQPGSAMNPVDWIRNMYRPVDNIVFKLDIDNDAVEGELIQQALAMDGAGDVIAEMFFRSIMTRRT